MSPAQLQDALKALPHGPEFRFLDRLVALDPGKEATGTYTVHGNEPFLRGHFPNEPLFPGVLLVEAAAQLAGIIVQTDPSLPAVPRLRLTAMRGVKIFDTARPGQTIEYQAKLLKRLGPLATAEATARVGDKVIMQAEITLSAG